ncbi:MAG: hypothetical protein NTX36_11865 [Proteobacteria bacterium]|nr:hypothetical protein [Pseudomonadota bacterium]
MRYMGAVLAGMIVVVLASSAQGELNLRPVHPDEPVGYTYNKRFSFDEAVTSLNTIRLSLESFRLLTEEAKGKISGKRLKEIGNTDWETQNLGFKNMPFCIEGALKKQDYLIKRLQHELAKYEIKDGRISEKELLEAKKSFETAEKSFQTFWDNSGIAD